MNGPAISEPSPQLYGCIAVVGFAVAAVGLMTACLTFSSAPRVQRYTAAPAVPSQPTAQGTGPGIVLDVNDGETTFKATIGRDDLLQAAPGPKHGDVIVYCSRGADATCYSISDGATTPARNSACIAVVALGAAIYSLSRRRERAGDGS